MSKKTLEDRILVTDDFKVQISALSMGLQSIDLYYGILGNANGHCKATVIIPEAIRLVLKRLKELLFKWLIKGNCSTFPQVRRPSINPIDIKIIRHYLRTE